MAQCTRCGATIEYPRYSRGERKDDTYTRIVCYDCPKCRFSQSTVVTYQGEEKLLQMFAEYSPKKVKSK